MRHRKKTLILGRRKSVKEAMLKNMVTSLVLYEEINTTKAKAKAIQPLVEKVITISKQNNLTSRRNLLELLYTKKAVNKALEVLGPRYKERAGGYTRITALNNRKGDGAEVVQIQLV
ncbi:MAG: 50S ribosomal protein L17 [Candidatus Buchananbacteria bacterium CG10_big_fil_rev_8_21_14_0_10_42_9]|uniref:50S ribosomal protein L17 n=1 Tax=Candidatus Buchananbacteria bacterium CG10_big_fil_rev_8_21_14_0_10_42_9 TaxID=1974526 RepID=A0A2H0W121_9BACT|nr:MAG: 50S ribosomal protein L17 [Candidatus Buchananbacteria bacterium CG10_big_fil_rev_8_21_14_0_10_42_9]